MNFSGIRVEADLTQPYGSRITRITTLDDKPFQAQKVYAVLMDSFITREEAGFPMLHEYVVNHPDEVDKDSQINSDYIKNYLLRQKANATPLQPSLDGRWQIKRD